MAASSLRTASCVALVALFTIGCPREDPAPTKVSDREPLIQPPKLPERTGPFKDPSVDPPGPREGGQLPAAELEKVIADGRQKAEAGQTALAMQLLRRCANKKPQSVSCEAELAIALTQAKKYKAHARYYLNEAAKVDDPETPSNVYRRLAKTAADYAQFEAAASALGIIANRGEATAQDHANRAGALQADSSRLADAVAAYAKAYELDPTSYEYLQQQATLLAQLEDYEKSIALFEEYKDKVGNHSPLVPMVDRRIAELQEALARRKKEGGGNAKPSAPEAPKEGKDAASPG